MENTPAPERHKDYPNLVRTGPGNNNGGGAKKGKPKISAIFNKLLSYKFGGDLTLLGIDTAGIPPEELLLLTNEEVIALQVIQKAARGDIAAAQMIYDRTEGKPVQVNHNLNAETTYTEYLEKLAAEEKQAVEDLLS